MNTGMPVESPVRGDSHAGFGGRLAETERPKGRHRAAGRPYCATRRCRFAWGVRPRRRVVAAAR